MTIEDIGKLPIPELMTKDSILLMWATYPKLNEAMWLIDHWGWEFKTVAFTWVKLNPSGVGWHFGLGYHSRQNPEIVLLATRGKGLQRAANDVPNLVISPRGQHSAKPPIVRERIERLYGDVSRIELFAREQVKGWSAWGNEVECSPDTAILEPFQLPPYELVVDEDEFMGLPVTDTVQEHYSPGEQMELNLCTK
jgi:N6-adenosine-specific RNA methylase IME4